MDARTTTVGDIMRTEMATLSPDERIDLADDIMRLGRVRHMPVVEDGRIVGIVSSHDVLAVSLTRVLDFDPTHRRAFLKGVEVKEVMSTDVVCLAPEASLREAAEEMLRRKIGCIPVVKPGDVLIGLVTETDLIEAALLGNDPTMKEEGRTMSDLQAKLDEEMEALKRVRDELRVQVHLGKAEAQELWEAMEHKWHEAESKLTRVARDAEEPLHEIGEAARSLLREIRDGYKQIRESL